MVEIGRFDDNRKTGNRTSLNASTEENKKAKKQELGKKIVEAYKYGKKAEVNNDTLQEINRIYKQTTLSYSNNIYSSRVAKEETDINNLIERGREPLKRPKEEPTVVLEHGPHGGKLEQFPQRANGTYRTIETLPNGETYECTYSQTGHPLNEIKRNGLNTQITTFNDGYTDKVSMEPLNGTYIVGKIQTGNMLVQTPPTLQEVTGHELNGFLIK